MKTMAKSTMSRNNLSLDTGTAKYLPLMGTLIKMWKYNFNVELGKDLGANTHVDASIAFNIDNDINWVYEISLIDSSMNILSKDINYHSFHYSFHLTCPFYYPKNNFSLIKIKPHYFLN